MSGLNDQTCGRSRPSGTETSPSDRTTQRPAQAVSDPHRRHHSSGRSVASVLVAVLLGVAGVFGGTSTERQVGAVAQVVEAGAGNETATIVAVESPS